MDDKEKIYDLMQKGKISLNQARMLLDSLEESRQRDRRVAHEILLLKKKRERKLWGFFSTWFFMVIVAFIFFLLNNTSEKLSKDIFSSMDYFNKVAVSLKNGDYKDAIAVSKKAVETVPRLPLGHIILGAIYRLEYERSNDEFINEEALNSFNKAEKAFAQLSNKSAVDVKLTFTIFLFFSIIFGVIGVFVLAFYETLVKDEESVNEAWAHVGSISRRKLDFIPAILDVAKNYVQKENDIIHSIIQARSQSKEIIEQAGVFAVSNKEKFDKFLSSQDNVTIELEKLFNLAGGYSDLDSDTYFLTLKYQLDDIHERILRERDVYNRRAKAYNSSIKSFPKNLVALLFNFKTKQSIGVEFEGAVE